MYVSAYSEPRLVGLVDELPLMPPYPGDTVFGVSRPQGAGVCGLASAAGVECRTVQHYAQIRHRDDGSVELLQIAVSVAQYRRSTAPP